MGVLAALTPPNWNITFFDDRSEKICYEIPTDLVAISIETYTAKRGYQIAAKFRQRGIPVVFGGYHATFCPDEALEQGDAVCIGEAEIVWRKIIAKLIHKGYKLDKTKFKNVQELAKKIDEY